MEPVNERVEDNRIILDDKRLKDGGSIEVQWVENNGTTEVVTYERILRHTAKGKALLN